MSKGSAVNPGPAKLFEEFLPKFSKITLEPRGWVTYASSTESLLMFSAMRDGRRVHVARSHSSTSGIYIDFKKANLQFDFTYDPEKDEAIMMQLLNAARLVAESKLLSGRIIRLIPASPFTDDDIAKNTYRSFKFEVEGEEIPGLTFPKTGFDMGISGPWHCFIPADSAEGIVIEAARKYYELCSRQVIDIVAEIAHAKSHLDGALQQVA
jgi:hypothetical protein